MSRLLSLNLYSFILSSNIILYKCEARQAHDTCLLSICHKRMSYSIFLLLIHPSLNLLTILSGMRELFHHHIFFRGLNPPPHSPLWIEYFLSHWCDTSCTCSWVYMNIVFAWEIKSISFSFHIIIIIIPSMPSTTYSPTIYMCVLSHILINFIFKLIMCLCVYANKINWIFSLYAESSEILYGETFYIFICGICYHSSSHPFCSVQQDF